MSPIDCEMNQSRIPYLFGCHGLIEIRGYPGVENLSELEDAPYGTFSAAGMIGQAPASL